MEKYTFYIIWSSFAIYHNFRDIDLYFLYWLYPILDKAEQSRGSTLVKNFLAKIHLYNQKRIHEMRF